jgi:formylglycine-generating enzyme
MEAWSMSAVKHLRLTEVEQRVCDVASRELGIPRERLSPSDRLIEDLRCDSFDLIEFILSVEQAFDVTLPDRPLYPVYNAVAT